MSHDNFHDALEIEKLIESICPKNNNYLLMDGGYEDDKTLDLAKAHGCRIIVIPKKIVNPKFHWFYDKQLYK